MAADPQSLFDAFTVHYHQAPSVPQGPTSIQDLVNELRVTPDSEESETESDVDNQEDWQDNANTVTGSIRGDTAEPDGDMGQHSTSDEEDQIISDNGEEGEEEEAQVALEESEFMTMAVIDSFKARSGETIRVKDIISMDNVVDDSEWFARVVDIRSTTLNAADENYKIWFKCHWFYTPSHIQDVMKADRGLKKRLTFDMDACGPKELIETPDHIEFFVSTVCKALAPVVVIRDDDERAVDQVPLPTDKHFSRIVFHLRQYKGSRLNYIPYSFKCCICERSPSKKRAKHKNKTAMHFCPNDGCKRWLHRECLMGKPYVLLRPPTTSLEPQLAECVPEWDSDELLQYHSGYSPSSTPPNQLRQILLKVAGRQIIREKGEPLANVRPICFARALLKMEKERAPGEEIDWHEIERIGFVRAELKRPVNAKDPPALEQCFWCPFCRSAI
ncbi:hypothetical protein M407DRAFT_22425 [Tulasnella calospora MUT 4182]|uniref:BAH domain-containing protein n=1 Tax=Tulasnella calospora MUT 4182 TaxID=1051891 RepID=A0A0C3QLD3_9AGAM|nr:hypothetical protein M407DRAFT_22425 [Tulasnella calospora MUT 4182]